MKPPLHPHTLTKLGPGYHLCCVFKTEQEHQKLLETFFDPDSDGKEKIIYVADTNNGDYVINNLSENKNVIKKMVSSGKLTIFKTDDNYTRSGIFDLNQITILIQNELEQALAGGFSNLRLIIEMSGAFKSLETSNNLISYESKFNSVFPNPNCMVICLYDWQWFDSKLLLDALAIHPHVVVGMEVYDNNSYQTPLNSKNQDIPGIGLPNWSVNLGADKYNKNELDHLSNAIKMSPDSILFSDLSGKIMDFNDATLNMCNVDDRAELVGHNLVDLIAPEERERAIQNLEKLIQNGFIKDQEYKILTKTGSELHVETKIDIMNNSEGEPVGYISIIRDVSDRKQTEDALKASEKKYQNLAESAMVGIYRTTLEGDILYVNSALANMFGFRSRSEMIRSGVIARYKDPNDRTSFIEMLKKNGNVLNFEFAAIGKDDNVINIIASGVLEGDIISGMLMDITAEKNTKKTMMESEEKYRTLFEASPELVMLIDPHGIILDTNDAIEHICGLTKDEIIGKRFSDLEILDKVQVKKLKELFTKKIKGKFYGNLELMININNQTKWLEASPALLKKDDKVYAIQLILRDITGRKRSEAELKKQLLKFQIEDGKLYFTKEPYPSISVEAFRDLMLIGYHGLAISRLPQRDLMKIIPNQNFEFIWLAEKLKKNSVLPRSGPIRKKVEDEFKNLSQRNVLLIVGLDYLIFKNGFKNTFNLIQRLSELAYITNNIIIMSIDSTTLTDRELRLLEKEGEELKPWTLKKKLPVEQLQIIKFIYEENIIGNKPSYTAICKYIGISKPTVRKRIRLLIDSGYVIANVIGRNKFLELTPKGRDLFIS